MTNNHPFLLTRKRKTSPIERRPLSLGAVAKRVDVALVGVITDDGADIRQRDVASSSRQLIMAVAPKQQAVYQMRQDARDSVVLLKEQLTAATTAVNADAVVSPEAMASVREIISQDMSKEARAARRAARKESRNG